MKTRYVVLLAAASLLVTMAVLFAAISMKGGQAADAGAAGGADRAELNRSHAPTLGRADAKVHIAEFLDPACGTCAEFYPLVKRMMAANPDRIRLSVRHVSFHKGADAVVRMLEASKKQGKYWQVLEALLAFQSTWVIQHVAKPELAWGLLAPLGLNLDQLKADMESPETTRNMATDMQDAKALKVTQTPEYFVNGRSMPEFGSTQLQQLVAQAIARAYP